MIETNQVLLERLKSLPAHEAWRDFYAAYWSPILRYARRMGLARHQAEEVLQETMIALMRILPEFDYDPRRGRFRNFLLTIVHRKALEALRRARRQGAVTVPLKGEEPGREDPRPEQSPRLPASGGDAADSELRWRSSLVEDCLAQLRADPEIDPRTREVFEAYVIQRRPARDVAIEFGLKDNAVYQIKNRLIRRLRATVERRIRDSGAFA